MNVIIGAAIVIVSVLGGFVLERGNLATIFQPVEVLIIGGAVVGSTLIMSPMKVFKEILYAIKGALSSKSYDKEKYIQVLTLLYEIFNKMRKEGIIAVETHVEAPENSEIFKRYPEILGNHRTLDFICDSIKTLLSIEITPYEFDNLLEVDIESNIEEQSHPVHRVAKAADALPGLGIVAAVLGVVLTMGKINEPPEVLGHSIGAALVGTFLGVLLCYGFVGPLASLMEHKIKEEESYYHVIRIALVSFVARSVPQIAIEFARRAIPESERPSFNELERIVKGKK
ncbi:MAG TPA: flagellar motor stator protein MotA [Deltaproteobacteria bacterium]|jgi:chemotaxis protein MotA|nr:flagellar motor stator protein MotA [Deltaproteobacteria bacterium]HOI07376.1 flagellar motor stator protein MotA [Deltaproteobacteria bacterium]